MAFRSFSSQNSRGSQGPRLAEAAFWLAAGLIILVWALLVAADLLPYVETAATFQTVLLRHSGASALLISLLFLGLISGLASLWALRSKVIPQPSASVLVITACALRAVQILSESSVSVWDANLLGALFLAAAILYHGPLRLWWTVMMPLATAAAFLPLVWLEYFKGAPNNVLIDALVLPGCAFVFASILIIIRDLRSRSMLNVIEIRQLRFRGESSMRALRSMEADMKTLTSALSRTAVAMAVPLSPFEELATAATETVEFTKRGTEATETCSFDEIETLARQLLNDARNSLQGSSVRLTLTTPSGGIAPIAVRGNLATVHIWLKSSLFSSLDAVGGFPGGVVRVNLKTGLSSIALSVEDNGRGIGEAAQAKRRRLEGHLTFTEIREGVEGLGGRFDLQARLGVGARLTIELPRVDAFATLPRSASTNRAVQKMSVTAQADFDQSVSSSPHA